MSETYLESIADAAARGLARRLSRRAAVSQFGRMTIAASLGAGGLALFPSRAGAHLTGTCGNCSPGAPTCCTDGTDSILCSDLPGWGQNSCPPSTVGCGSWTAGTCNGGTGTLRMADCCGNCNNGALCECIGGRPTCCRHQLHRNGASDDCATNHIKCRRSFCSP